MDVAQFVAKRKIQETGKNISFVFRYLEQSVTSERKTTNFKKYHNYNANNDSANNDFLSKTSSHSDDSYY